MPHQNRRTRRLYERNAYALLRDAETCVWCLRPISTALPVGHPQKATADHWVPLSLGGSDELENLVPACGECNSQRGNRTPAAFLRYLVAVGKRKPPEHSREW